MQMQIWDNFESFFFIRQVAPLQKKQYARPRNGAVWTVLSLINFYRATACNATHDIVVADMSVRLSVCPSVRCVYCEFVTKLNNALRIF